MGLVSFDDYLHDETYEKILCEMQMKLRKKGAIELSIGTIVIIVLAMSMLILGIILIKNIFSGSTNAVDDINKGVINVPLFGPIKYICNPGHA